MTPDCRPVPNGYMAQVDCATHATPWPCTVTAEEWVAYLAKCATPTDGASDE